MARTATHATCEDHHRLDVLALARDGLLTGTGVLTWTRGGHVTGSISVKGDGDSVTLSYALDGQEIEEQIRLTTTPVHLGGHRFWFRCPGCDRRVAVLYGGARFRCRHCHDLRYSSQREPPRFRAISRIQRVRMKLLGTGDLTQPRPPRPRYMHRRTYQRLIKEEIEAWRSYAHS